jgi:hypothetical protein
VISNDFRPSASWRVEDRQSTPEGEILAEAPLKGGSLRFQFLQTFAGDQQHGLVRQSMDCRWWKRSPSALHGTRALERRSWGPRQVRLTCATWPAMLSRIFPHTFGVVKFAVLMILLVVISHQNSGAGHSMIYKIRQPSPHPPTGWDSIAASLGCSQKVSQGERDDGSHYMINICHAINRF